MLTIPRSIPALIPKYPSFEDNTSRPQLNLYSDPKFWECPIPSNQLLPTALLVFLSQFKVLD